MLGLSIIGVLIAIDVSFDWNRLQNGTTEEVKKIVSMLNEAEVPSEEIVGMIMQ